MRLPLRPSSSGLIVSLLIAAPLRATALNALSPSPRLTNIKSRPSTQVRMAVLPAAPTLAAACVLPTCLGFWKSEYGVSYAYGAATATVGALVLRAAPTPLAAVHAAAVAFYGLRLNVFLLWRELNVARFRDFREKIEARAVESGGRLKRTPFVLSCALLYYCMCCPILISSRLGLAPSVASVGLVVAAWAGLLLAAVGDAYKSFVKARKGSDVLVTGGPFAIFRHPNYTGEQILWSANLLCAIAAAATSPAGAVAGVCSVGGLLGASVVGWAGILFILARATSSLEKKQAERVESLVKWKQRSWSGFALKD